MDAGTLLGILSGELATRHRQASGSSFEEA